MILRVFRAFCFPVLCAGLVASGQQPSQVPLNDTPPTLSLPPLPSLPKAPEQAAPPPPKEAPVTKPNMSGLAPKKPALTLPADRQSSTSGDGQFIVHGADLATRTWFTNQCETIASDLRKLLHDPAPWGIPINISVRTAPNISLTDQAVIMGVRPMAPSGFQLQVTVQMRPDLNTNDLRSELIRVLLAERILRDHRELTSTRRPVLPEWLFTGVTEALRFRERARPSATFAAVFKTGKVFGIEEILGAAPTSMDALSRSIYETSACALVLMLLDQPEGNIRMAKFLHALASDSRSDGEVLKQWFPGLAQSKTSLDKWWSLEMAHMSRPSVWETLDPQETAKALELALAFHYDSEVEVDDTPAKPKAKATESDPEEKPKATEEEEKRSFFGRLFGSSGAAKEEDKPKEEKPKETAKPEKKPEPESADKAQPSLLTRLFGGSDDKKKDEPKKPAKKEEPEPKKPEPKKEEPKKEAPKKEEPKPKPEPKKEESKKSDKSDQPGPPSLIRRWFSGGKDKDKSKDEKKPEPEKKKDEEPKKSASLSAPVMLRLLADISLPQAGALLDAQAFVSSPASRAVIFGFGKKKDADKSKDDKKDEPKKKPEPKKEEPKKPAKKEEPKPEAKKEEPKKEPAPATKPAAKKRIVTVSVPVEDYAKVLKRGDGKAILANTITDLSALSQRAHPLFKSDHRRLHRTHRPARQHHG